MTNIDKERKAFEQAMKDRLKDNPPYFGRLGKPAQDQYIVPAIQTAWIGWQARAKQHSGEAVAKVVRNSSGQIHITDAKGDYFDVSKYIGAELYLSPQQPQSVDIASIILDVAELPDRTSPDDFPNAMLVTVEELREIIERNLITQQPQQVADALEKAIRICEDEGYFSVANKIRNLINQPTCAPTKGE